MSPEAQRIAIAEACGCNKAGNYWCAKIGPLQNMPRDSNGLPYFLTDLNAMHEAEKALTRDQQLYFTKTILRLYNGTMCKDKFWMGATPFDIAHATAAQRAEAFLRTIGKWVES